MRQPQGLDSLRHRVIYIAQAALEPGRIIVMHERRQWLLVPAGQHTWRTTASREVFLASATAASAVRNCSKVMRRDPFVFTCSRRG